MQTPAEQYLVTKAIVFLRNKSKQARILNVGASTSTVIEEQLLNNHCNFIEDRVDIDNCRVDFSFVHKHYFNSVESMPEVKSDNYDLILANYVLEHVQNLDIAAKEIYRTLKPAGCFIATLPNPKAPEFIISKFTPLQFHQFVKGMHINRRVYKPFYNYKNISSLISIFSKAGFWLLESKYYPFAFGYLYRFPILNLMSKSYDKLIAKLNSKALMGQVCLVFEKTY